MTNQMQVYYDEEGDFLEINIGPFTEGYFEDISEGVAKRVDEKTGKITGIAILGFRQRAHSGDLKINLPFKLEIKAV